MQKTFELGDGKRIPDVGFGTFQIPPTDSERCTTLALQIGYRHIDTAEFYQNESGVGKALLASGLERDSVFVTTKLDPGAVIWGQTAKTYETAVASCKQSLEALGLSYIDLYLIHTPLSGKEGRLAQYTALLECQRLGLCKSVGVSNYEISHLQEIESAGLPPPAANQVELHPMCQKRALLDHMRARKILPIAYSSLAPLSSWREGYVAAFTGSKSGDAKSTPDVIREIAERVGVTEARLLLRYALQKGWPVLPKSVKEDRMRANLDLHSFHIPDAEMATLDAMDQDAAYAFGQPGKPFDPSKVD